MIEVLAGFTAAFSDIQIQGGRTIAFLRGAGVQTNGTLTLNCGGLVSLDQRGATRPSPAVGNCDIGAFEIDPNFTLASVSSFKALLTENGTVLAWETDSEVGTLGPAALSRHGGAALLGKALIRAIYGHGAVRLGDALLIALEEYRGTGADPVLLRTYNLLGDPAVSVETAFLEPSLLDEPLTPPPPVPDFPEDDGQPAKIREQ